MSSYRIRPEIRVAQLGPETIEDFNPGHEILVLVSRSVRSHFELDAIFSEAARTRKLHVFDHVRPDAPFEDIDRIINDMKGTRPDGIVAIGGGSVIDAAKALSISFSGVSYKDIFYGTQENPETKVKVLAIPTTAGTGAELSFGAILYDKANKVKGGVRGVIVQPDAVLIDARLHNACPFKLKAEVGFDCLTHAIETYISKKSNPLVRAQSVSCIQHIFNHLPPACREDSILHMEKVAIHSALMGINLAYSSTCLPHRLQYVIGPLTGTSHAQGLIALYKGWIPHLINNNISEFNALARDLQTEPSALHEAIENLKQQLGIEYSLADLGVEKNQIEEIAGSVTGTLTADPSYRDNHSLLDILKLAL
jgi:alcohol dehydrogenase class IV